MPAVRTGRRRHLIVVVLLGVALGANGIALAIAESIWLSPYPYPNTERILRLAPSRDGARIRSSDSSSLLDEWSQQRDLFSAVGSYKTGNVLIFRNEAVVLEPVTDVTFGMLEVLGVRPIVGRAFIRGDQRSGEALAVVSESVARQYFGNLSAIGEDINTSDGPLRVVGVLPDRFRFPTTEHRIWRLMTESDVRAVAQRLPILAAAVPSVALDAVREAVGLRATEIGRHLGLVPYVVEVREFEPAIRPAIGRVTGAVLATAGFLLVVAAANAAILQLVSVIQRRRREALLEALGATWFAVRRAAAVELLVVTAASFALGLGTAFLGVQAVAAAVPPGLMAASGNVIDIDGSVVVYLAVAACLVFCLLVALDVGASTQSAVMVELRGRIEKSARLGRRSRSVLVMCQLAVAVVMLSAAVVFVGTYRGALSESAGIDTEGLAQVEVLVPKSLESSQAGLRRLANLYREALLQLPGIEAVTVGFSPPMVGGRTALATPEVQGMAPTEEPILVAVIPVESDYSDVTGMRVAAGRWLTSADPVNSFVVSAPLARRLWSGRDAVGSAIRLSPPDPWARVVGVAGDTKWGRASASADDEGLATVYRLLGPDELPSSGGGGALSLGPAWSIVGLVVRFGSKTQASTAPQLIEQVTPGVTSQLSWVDGLYLRYYGDLALGSTVVGSLGVLATVLAIVGLYSVMAHVVSTRRQELTIRAILGATRSQIRWHVLEEAARLGAVGSGVGIAAAWAGSRVWTSVAPDLVPASFSTYMLVGGAVVMVGVGASWRLAAQAAGMRLSSFLRAE